MKGVEEEKRARTAIVAQKLGIFSSGGIRVRGHQALFPIPDEGTGF